MNCVSEGEGTVSRSRPHPLPSHTFEFYRTRPGGPPPPPPAGLPLPRVSTRCTAGVNRCHRLYLQIHLDVPWGKPQLPHPAIPRNHKHRVKETDRPTPAPEACPTRGRGAPAVL